MMQCFFVSSSNMHVELHCWLVQPRQRMALQLCLCKPCHDTFSVYWSVLTMSVELKERHAWVHTDFPQKTWNMLLFGGKITFSFFFFFKYYSTYSIYIYIKTHYPHFTTRQPYPEWICRSPLSLSTPISPFLKVNSKYTSPHHNYIWESFISPLWFIYIIIKKLIAWICILTLEGPSVAMSVPALFLGNTVAYC